MAFPYCFTTYCHSPSIPFLVPQMFCFVCLSPFSFFFCLFYCFTVFTLCPPLFCFLLPFHCVFFVFPLFFSVLPVRLCPTLPSLALLSIRLCSMLYCSFLSRSWCRPHPMPCTHFAAVQLVRQYLVDLPSVSFSSSVFILSLLPTHVLSHC